MNRSNIHQNSDSDPWEEMKDLFFDSRDDNLRSAYNWETIRGFRLELTLMSLYERFKFIEKYRDEYYGMYETEEEDEE